MSDATTSQSNEVGLADYISTTSALVDNGHHPRIAHDMENEHQIHVDEMLKYLLYRCTDDSVSESDKAELFKTCLEAVSPICNADPVPATQKSAVVRKLLCDFTSCIKERQTYASFVKVANTALLELTSKKSTGNFNWQNVLTTFEFKHRKNKKLRLPQKSYNVKYDPSVMDSLGAKAPVRTPEGPANQGDKKRTFDHLDFQEATSCKRLKIDSAAQEDDKNIKNANIQTGLYAAEKFATHVGLQHVMCPVVNDDMIHIWYIDRQKAIRSSGFNFVQDLPRLLVFLLIMQRLPLKAWGYNKMFEPDPEAESCYKGWSNVTYIQKKTEGEKLSSGVDLRFNLNKRTTHYGLCGRATIVMPVESRELSTWLDQDSENESEDLIAKLHWEEESREPEYEILKKVKRIAAKNNKVKGHVPEMVWYHRFDETSTAKVRKALGMDDAEQGSRVLHIVVFRKLFPMTNLSGKEFLRAWWETVECHHALWKNNIHHCDISPPNLMFYRNKKNIFGVLNDFDLSSTTDNPTANECTGTMPFMAIGLLTVKAIKGEVKHLYQHDAEAFIWVLTSVSIQFKVPVDDWQRTDVVGCHDKKCDFILRHRQPLSSLHEFNSVLVQSLLRIIGELYCVHGGTELEVDFVFQTWFGQVEAYL